MYIDHRYTKNKRFLGAHMRRGNYVEESRQEYGYIPASKDYLHHAISYFEAKFNPERNRCLFFLILGNDYTWNLANSPRQSNIAVFLPNLTVPAIDLCLLASCDHVIMSTGTFSWWAGFLSGGHVTYQKEFARPHSELANMTNAKDFYLPFWVPL